LGNLFFSLTALNSGEIDVRTVSQPLGTGERYTVSNMALGPVMAAPSRIVFRRRAAHLFARNHLAQLAVHVRPQRWNDLPRCGKRFAHRREHFQLRLAIRYDAAICAFNTISIRTNMATTARCPAKWSRRIVAARALSRRRELAGAPTAATRSCSRWMRFIPTTTPSMSVGAEWSFLNAFRARRLSKYFPKDSEVGPTAGAGLHYDFDGLTLHFDYGWATTGWKIPSGLAWG
jgi:hypothetical protein